MYKNHTIAILHNQILPTSPEDVLDIERQAKWIAEILRDKGYKTLLVPFSLDALSRLAKENLDSPCLVFNLTDSAPGEENLAYLVPGLLEHLNLSYTGCSLQNLYVTTNKMLAKRVLKAAGIDTPPWVCNGETDALLDSAIRRYIIKPISEDASIGLDESSIVSSETVVEKLDAKEEALLTPCFAEAFIEGREFTACMYGTPESCTVLTPYEWVFQGYEEHQKEKIITYDAKWTENSFGYEHIVAKYRADACDLPLLEKLAAIARKCWSAFSLTGYARVDFRIDEAGKPWVLEVNCNPSFYGFYHLALEGGFPFEDLVQDIVEQVV
ncbi:MAG: ATP-grasp domain-containing protein [Spirochaetia bacterium]|jgi:D-alanine-D-alanine ligase|nr:ATP-grasp domain-containing protein [Spirochaetia bacterium]